MSLLLEAREGTIGLMLRGRRDSVISCAPPLCGAEPGPGKQEGSRSSPYAAGEGGVACLASASSECYVVSGGSHGLYSGLGEMRAWRCESWERVQQLQESAHAGQVTHQRWL